MSSSAPIPASKTASARSQSEARLFTPRRASRAFLPRAQPCDDLVGVPVWWKDRIEHVRDLSRLEYERDPLVQRHSVELEGRKRQRLAESERWIGDDGKRHVLPLR